MICIRCMHSNSGGQKFCASCQAVLPVQLVQERGFLDLDDRRVYEAPAANYPNRGLEELYSAYLDYEDGHGDEAIWAATEQLRASFVELEAAAPAMLEAVRSHLAECGDDEAGHQVTYLLQFGSQRFAQALDRFQLYLEGADEDAPAILDELQSGNDYLCHSATLAAQMLGPQ